MPASEQAVRTEPCSLHSRLQRQARVSRGPDIAVGVEQRFDTTSTQSVPFMATHLRENMAETTKHIGLFVAAPDRFKRFDARLKPGCVHPVHLPCHTPARNE